MKKLLTPWELTPLFASEGGVCSSGGIEGELKLLSVSEFWAITSLFVLYWNRTMPKSPRSWMIWSSAYIAVLLIIAFVSSHGKLELEAFLVSFLPLVFPVLKCYMNSVSKYASAVKRCVTVLNADKTQPPLTEEQIKALLRNSEVTNLMGFKQFRRALLISTSKTTSLNRLPSSSATSATADANQSLITKV